MRGFRSLSTISLIILLFLSPLWAEEGTVDVPLSKLEEVTDLIMSPGCNYIYTLTNCPSVEAVELRKLVRDRLAKGETKEEILNYLVEVYGPRILASPQKKGFFLLAWWVPYVAVIDGAIIIAVVILLWRRRKEKEAKDDKPEEIDREYEEKVEEELRKLDL